MMMMAMDNQMYSGIGPIIISHKETSHQEDGIRYPVVADKVVIEGSEIASIFNK